MGGDKVVPTFLNDIRLKVDIIVQLEFELTSTMLQFSALATTLKLPSLERDQRTEQNFKMDLQKMANHCCEPEVATDILPEKKVFAYIIEFLKTFLQLKSVQDFGRDFFLVC